MSLLRPNFQARELLTSADLNAALLYQIDLGRKHRVGAHLPGVVSGLQMEKTAGGLMLRQGYAVDEFGRDLVLVADEVLDPRLADAQRDRPGADTFEVLLHYNKQPVVNNGRPDYSRINEAPRVEVRALVGKPDERVPFDRTQSAPDDPAFERPVQLGVLKSAPDEAGEWILLQDPDHREETGVVASAIVPRHDEKSRLTLTNGEFAVVLPSAMPAADPQQAAGKDQEPGEDSKRLSVTANGAVFRSPLVIEGDIEAGHQLLLSTPAPAADRGCGLYLIGDSKNAPDTQELRLVLPANGALAIGAWNPQSGKFEALLTVDAANRSVNVAGDLIIEGAVVEPVGATATNPNPSSGTTPEDTGMFGSLLTSLLTWVASPGNSTTKLIVLLVALLGGVYSDQVSSSVLSCSGVNSIRGIFGMNPLICRGKAENPPEDGPSTIFDSSCAVKKSGGNLAKADFDPAFTEIKKASTALNAANSKVSYFWIQCKDQ